MSRSVKDLREIICLSRQMQIPTFAPSGSICDEPDDESSRTSSRLSTNSFSPATSGSLRNGSCDDNSDDESTLPALRLPLSPPDSASRLHRLRYDNPQPLSDRSQPSVDQPATVFPRHKPLPAVGISHNSSRLQSSSEQRSCKNVSNNHSIHKTANMRSVSVLTSHVAEVRTSCRFDEVFSMIDHGVILIWLEQVNRSVMDIVSWCQDSDSFVRLAHFWLSEFPENRQHEIFKLEYGLLCERLKSAFGGKKPPSLSADKFESFMQAILHEYPDGLLCGERKGTVLFLQHLEIIAVSKRRKALLADVRYATVDRRHFETLLAVRSYAVVSVWSAILDQFRSGEDSKSSTLDKTPRPGTASRSGRTSRAGNRPMSVRPQTARPLTARNQDVTGDDASGDDDGTNWNLQKLFDAVRLGYIDVVQHLFDTHKIESDVCDANRKSLIFIAAVNSQLSMLKFLLTMPGCDVNLAADSGNTPLHVAANRGDVAVTGALLEAENIRVDAPNAECNDATPLLLAALHGHTQVVKLLLEAGADTTKTMSGQTAMDIARDFDHPDIVSLFEKRQK